jgi:hypothetical protein
MVLSNGTVHNKTVFFQIGHRNFWRERKKKLDRPWKGLCMSGRIMKRFAAIEFKQKWIMPFCSLTHLALDWYWTLIGQIDLRLSNRLGTSTILISLAEIFRPFFAPARNFYVRFGKIQSYIIKLDRLSRLSLRNPSLNPLSLWIVPKDRGTGSGRSSKNISSLGGYVLTGYVSSKVRYE